MINLSAPPNQPFYLNSVVNHHNDELYSMKSRKNLSLHGTVLFWKLLIPNSDELLSPPDAWFNFSFCLNCDCHCSLEFRNREIFFVSIVQPFALISVGIISPFRFGFIIPWVPALYCTNASVQPPPVCRCRILAAADRRTRGSAAPGTPRRRRRPARAPAPGPEDPPPAR